jgi:hypothetical protein
MMERTSSGMKGSWSMWAVAASVVASMGCSDSGANSFTYRMSEYTAEPGEEFTHCMRVPIPEQHRTDGPMYVTGFESWFPFGTHHFFAYYSPTPPEDTLVDEPAPCLGDDPKLDIVTAVFNPQVNRLKQGQGVTFGAPEGPGEYFLPPGYGMHFPSTEGFFVTDHHVLNLTSDVLDVGGGHMTYHYSPPEEIDKSVRFMFCENLDVNIPARSEHTLEVTCTFPEDVEIVVLSSHAHLYLTRFEQRIYDGEQTLPDPIYVSTDWDSPEIAVLDEPLRLSAGMGITVTCHYDNPTDDTIIYGVGEWGEMCVAMNMMALPIEQEAQYGLGAQVEPNGGIGEMVRNDQGVFQ